MNSDIGAYRKIELPSPCVYYRLRNAWLLERDRQIDSAGFKVEADIEAAFFDEAMNEQISAIQEAGE